MLHPLFRQRLLKDVNKAPLPDTEDSREGIEYKIIGFSQFQEYTLLTWEYSNDQNSFVGESLYRGFTPIATGGGRIPVYEIPSVIPDKSKTFRPWEMGIEKQLDPSTGQFGLPPNVGIELRNPKRIRRF